MANTIPKNNLDFLNQTYNKTVLENKEPKKNPATRNLFQ